MKEIFWSEVGGAATAGVVVATIKSGKVLPNVKDLDLIVAGGIVVADAIVSEHLGSISQAVGNGMAAYGVGYLAQQLLNRTVLKPTTSTSSTPAASMPVLYTTPSPSVVSPTPTASTNSTGYAATAMALQTAPTSGGVASLSTN